MSTVGHTKWTPAFRVFGLNREHEIRNAGVLFVNRDFCNSRKEREPRNTICKTRILFVFRVSVRNGLMVRQKPKTKRQNQFHFVQMQIWDRTYGILSQNRRQDKIILFLVHRKVWPKAPGQNQNGFVFGFWSPIRIGLKRRSHALLVFLQLFAGKKKKDTKWHLHTAIFWPTKNVVTRRHRVRWS